MFETGDEARDGWVGAGRHDNWDAARAFLGGLQCLERASNDHVNPKTLKLGGLRRHHLSLAVGIARLDDEARPFGVAKFAHPLTECVHGAVGGTGIAPRHPADTGDLRRLLRSGRERQAHQ